MSHRLFLVRTGLALVVGMMFVASATQATALTGGAVAQATDQVTPSIDSYFAPVYEPTRITTTLSGIVTTPRLRVRDAATLNGKVLFFLGRGQIVTILGIHRNRRWIKIQTGDGKVGWASPYYIQLVGGTLKLLAFVE